MNIIIPIVTGVVSALMMFSLLSQVVPATDSSGHVQIFGDPNNFISISYVLLAIEILGFIIGIIFSVFSLNIARKLEFRKVGQILSFVGYAFGLLKEVPGIQRVITSVAVSFFGLASFVLFIIASVFLIMDSKRLAEKLTKAEMTEMKRILETFADEIETEAEFFSILPEIEFWGKGRKSRDVYTFDPSKRYFHVYYERSASFTEWANYVLTFDGENFVGFILLSIQGVLEQAGAYAQAERLLVQKVIVPLMWSEFPSFQGEMKLTYQTYQLNVHQTWHEQIDFGK